MTDNKRHTELIQFVHELERQGVSFTLNEGDRLNLTAAQGVITPERAARIRDAKADIIGILKRRTENSGPREALPLTPSQERMWSHASLHPELPLYVIPAAFEITGPLEAERLRQAFRKVAAHFDVFRLRIDETGEEILQSFDADLPDPPVLDLSSDPGREQRLKEEMDRVCWPQIDLRTETPVRTSLVRMGEEHHWLLMGLHHLAWDGRSFRLFLEALSDAYMYPEGELAPASQFSAYAAAMAGFAAEELDWWKGQLTSPPEPPELSQDRPRPALFDHAGSVVEVPVSPDLLDRIRQFARARKTTTFSVFLGAFSAFLSRIDGSSDRIIGLDSDERPDAYEGSIGNYVNTVLLRDRTCPESIFSAAIEDITKALPGFLEHPVPVGEIVIASGFQAEPSRPTAAQIMISHQYSESYAPSLGAAKVRRVDLPPRTTAAELAFNMLEGEKEIAAEFQYATSLFSEGQVRALADAFASFLSAAIEAPEQKVADLPMTTSAMKTAYDALNATTIRDEPETALSAFLSHASAAPQDTALIFHDETVSYGELAARAQGLAHGLAGLGAGPGEIVGIALERSPDMVASVYAVWMTGAAYLPLDPEFPEERRALMIEDSGCELVIGTGDGQLSPASLAKDHEGKPFVPVAADIAYVMYTSGSTGRPKGVVNGHAQVANFLRSMMKKPGCAADDRLLAVTTLGFDISILELFLPLYTGAAVILPDAEEAIDGDALARLCTAYRASIMQGTPATWRLMLDAGWQGQDGIKALCGGEALPSDLVRTLLPKVSSLWNMYGPTETTVWSTVKEVLSAGQITIGTPIDNTQCYVMAPGGQLCPPGLPGELWIGGDGVALGYYGREDLTVERFLPDPFSDESDARVYRTGDRARLTPEGELVHLGRMDTQLKLRGFRIEAGEIEASLVAHEDIAEAVAVIREQQNGEKALVAYFTAAGIMAPTGSDLRRWLRTRLPQYMVPQLFVELDRLPLTPNGKIDRLALPAPAGEAMVRRQYVAPQPGHEAELAKIWAEILNARDISSTDNFFELGGQSLQAARVAAIFRARTGARIQPRALIFETLAQLAAGAVEDAA